MTDVTQRDIDDLRYELQQRIDELRQEIESLRRRLSVHVTEHGW